MHIRIECVLLDLCGPDRVDQNTQQMVREMSHLFSTKYEVRSM